MRLLLRHLRRVLTGLVQYPPEVDNARAIQVQSLHGRPTRGRPPDEDSEFLVPDEVIGPPVPARVEQRRQLSRRRVDGFRTRELVIVAALAGERQIIKVVSSAAGSGHNVLDRERGRGESERTQAVFAAPTRPRRDRFTLGPCGF